MKYLINNLGSILKLSLIIFKFLAKTLYFLIQVLAIKNSDKKKSQDFQDTPFLDLFVNDIFFSVTRISKMDN